MGLSRSNLDARRKRRLAGGLLLCLVLTAVLALLVTLQSRWLGQLSDAQGEQTRITLQSAASRIGSDLQATLVDVEEAVLSDPEGFDETRYPAVSSVTVYEADTATTPNKPSFTAQGLDGRSWTIALDRGALQEVVFPELVRRALGEGGLDTYRIDVVSRTAPLPALFRSHPSDSITGEPDASADLSLQPNRWVGLVRGETMKWTEKADPPSELETPIFIADTDPEKIITLESEAAGWRVEIRHQSGSLDAALTRARRQNLVLGGALLSLIISGLAFFIAAERRARQLAEKELAFVAGISHELRTPLTVVRTAASNLAQQVVTDPDRIRDYGSLIEREATRVTEMAERVLQFSTGSRPELSPTPIPIAGPLDEAIARCRPWRDRKPFDIDVRIDKDAEIVRADAAAITSLLHNLIDNAIKYGGESPAITVRITPEVHRRTHGISIRVEDQGPGIAPADRGHIFDPFYRGAGVRGSALPGNGLGLAVSRELVHAHGGRLDVCADRQVGAAVIAFFPHQRENDG